MTLGLSVTCESTGLVLNVNGLSGTGNRICYLISESDCEIQKISIGPSIANCFFSVKNNVAYTLINEIDEDHVDETNTNDETDTNTSIEQRCFTINMIEAEFDNNYSVAYLTCINARIIMTQLGACGINNLAIAGLALYTNSSNKKYVEPYDVLIRNDNIIEFDDLPVNTTVKLSFFAKYDYHGVHYTTCPSCLLTATTTDSPETVTGLTCVLDPTNSYPYNYDASFTPTTGVKVTWGTPNNLCDDTIVSYTLIRTLTEDLTIIDKEVANATSPYIDTDNLIIGQNYTYSVRAIFTGVDSVAHEGDYISVPITYLTAPLALTINSVTVNNTSVNPYLGTYYVNSEGPDVSVTLDDITTTMRGGYPLDKVYYSTSTYCTTNSNNLHEITGLVDTFSPVSGPRYYFFSIIEEDDNVHYSPLTTLTFLAYEPLDQPSISVSIPDISYTTTNSEATVSWSYSGTSVLGGTILYDVTATDGNLYTETHSVSVSPYIFSLVPNKSYTFTVVVKETLTTDDDTITVESPPDSVDAFAYRASSAVPFTINYSNPGVPIVANTELANVDTPFDTNVFNQVVFTTSTPTTLGAYAEYTLNNITTGVLTNISSPPYGFNYDLNPLSPTIDVEYSFKIQSTTPNGLSGEDSSTKTITHFVDPGKVTNLSATFSTTDGSPAMVQLTISGNKPASATGVEVFVDGIFLDRSISSPFSITKIYSLSDINFGESVNITARPYKIVQNSNNAYRAYIGERNDITRVYVKNPTCSITASEGSSRHIVNLVTDYDMGGHFIDSATITKNGTTIYNFINNSTHTLQPSFPANNTLVLAGYNDFTFVVTIHYTHRNTLVSTYISDSSTYNYSTYPTVTPVVNPQNSYNVVVTISPNGGLLSNYIVFATPYSSESTYTASDLQKSDTITHASITANFELNLTFTFPVLNVFAIVSNPKGFGVGQN